MAIPFFLNIIGLVAQLETVIAIQTALVNLARERQQPTTGIDGLWGWGQVRRAGKFHPRWLVVTGEGLVGSFKGVEVDISSIYSCDYFEGTEDALS